MWIKDLLFGGPGGASKVADIGLLVMRVVAGTSMAIAHGLGKVKDPSRVVSGAEKLGFPIPILFGYSAVAAEFLGGLCIAIGLFCRPAAAALAFTMGVAAFMVHGKDPFKTKELAIVYLVISLALVCTGAGRYSVDRLIKK